MFFDLEYILHPFDKKKFIKDYLDVKPLILQKNERDYFKALANFEDVHSLFPSGSLIGNAHLEIIHPKKILAWSEYSLVKKIENSEIRFGLNSHKVNQLFDGHATVILGNLKQTHSKFYAMARKLEDELSCTVDISARICIANSSTFPAFYKTNDLFLIQAEGSQSLRIYNSAIELPLGIQSSLLFEVSDENIYANVNLNEGDVVFIPRGFPFQRMDNPESMIELSVDFSQPTWTKLLIDTIYSAAGEEPLLREGFFTKDLEGQSNKDEALVALKQKLFERTDKLAIEKVKNSDTKEDYSLQKLLGSI